jgi:hypothetical protein
VFDFYFFTKLPLFALVLQLPIWCLVWSCKSYTLTEWLVDGNSGFSSIQLLEFAWKSLQFINIPTETFLISDMI